jgi:hypothetical protein
VEVLKDLFGLADKDIEALRSAGAVAS